MHGPKYVVITCVGPRGKRYKRRIINPRWRKQIVAWYKGGKLTLRGISECTGLSEIVIRRLLQRSGIWRKPVFTSKWAHDAAENAFLRILDAYFAETWP